MSIERATKSGTRQQMLSYLEAAQRRVSQRQEAIGSGRRLLHPSDGPADAAQAMAQRRRVDRLAQFTRNSESARSWLDTSSAALTAGSDVLIRARTLVVQGRSGTHTPQSREAIAAEIDAMAEQLLAIANTTVNGRPVFSGTSGQATAFNADGSYAGTDVAVVRAVDPGRVLEVGRPGTASFGEHDPLDPMEGNAIQVLRASAAAVRAGDTTGMERALLAVDGASDRMLAEVGRLGSLGAQLEALDGHRSEQVIDAQRQLSNLQDVDLAEAFVKLTTAETSYEATLAATSKLLGTSLLDFMR